MPLVISPDNLMPATGGWDEYGTYYPDWPFWENNGAYDFYSGFNNGVYTGDTLTGGGFDTNPTGVGFGDPSMMIPPADVGFPGPDTTMTGGTTGTGFDSGHGSLDPNANPTQYPGPQWPGLGIGIPGLFGVGAGGLMTGGLIDLIGGGGGSAGGNGGYGGESPELPVIPPIQVTPPADGTATLNFPAENQNPTPALYPQAPVAAAPNGDNQPQDNPTIMWPPPASPPQLTGVSPNENQQQTILPVIPPLPGNYTAPPAPVGPTGPSTPSTPSPTTPMPTISMVNPMDRNFYAEGNQTIGDLSRLGSGLQGLYSQFAPGYAQGDMNTYAGLLGSLGVNNQNLTGIASQQTQESNRALRAGNLADAANFGPQAQAIQRQLNPEMYSSMVALDQAAQRGISASPYEQGLGNMFNSGRSDLGNSLVQTAQDQLRMGGSLSGEEQRAASQAAREGWSARGLVNSTGAVAEEVLNRYNLANQRRNERQNFAQGVFNQEMADQSQRTNLGMGLSGLDYQRQQQGVNNLSTAANMRAATSFDPFNFQSSQNVGQNQSLFGNATGFTSGAYGDQYAKNLFNPFAPYPQDVYGSNFNAANARSIAQSNNQAAAAGARDANNAQFVNAFLGFLGGT